MSVPHLTTALKGPMHALERNFLEHQAQIEQWLRSKWYEHSTPFYGSVDLRNSGFKLAPVDMNLFPGGFNNLNPEFIPLAVHAAINAVERVCSKAKGVLLIPENHTRNIRYLQNISSLAHILRQAGLNVRIGSLNEDITEPTLVSVPGDELLFEPLQRKNNCLVLADGFNPCLVLLNNDLSAGVPEILKGLDQSVFPPLHAGWSMRSKTQHFTAYDGVAKQFAELLSIDQWLINSYFTHCGGIDFHARSGEDQLAESVQGILDRTLAKYNEHSIKQEPFVIVKADAGTYGMGIMSVKSAEDVIGLNRKARNKMAVVKDGLNVHDVILQEGVYTFETINNAVAEPVVYMLDRFVVGGFYRVHTGRGIDENLNAPGMSFEPLSFAAPCLPDHTGHCDCAPNRFYSYGVIARLSLLAASLELENTDPHWVKM